MWMINEESPDEVFASIPLRPGYAAEFTQFIKVKFPEKIISIASLPDALVAFSATSVYAVAGDGPDASGNGEFTAPRILTQAAGVDRHSSALLANDAILFHSIERGLWAISLSGAVQELTMQVEDVLVSPIQSSLFRPDVQRAEFYLENGIGLWYDLRHKRWTSQWLYGDLKATCYHGGATMHVRSKVGVINDVCKQAGFVRDQTYLGLTGSYPMVLRTGWIKFDGLLGFSRVWWESVLGRFRDDHTIEIQRFVNFISTVAESTSTKRIGTDPGAYILRHKPIRQKVGAVQYRIEITANAAPYASVRLNVLELVVGLTRKHAVRGRYV
jgi:hypothetical protein